MNIKKYAPWNWFKDEEQEAVPVRTVKHSQLHADPITHLHNEIDRLFDDAFRGFPRRSLPAGWISPAWPESSSVALKPNLDIKDDEKSYTVTIEVPGVAKDDVDIEIDGSALKIRGEKRQEKREEKESYHCIERSYGSFERVLSLPRDANPDNTDASFKDGVLTIKIERQTTAGIKEGGRKIEVKAAA